MLRRHKLHSYVLKEFYRWQCRNVCWGVAIPAVLKAWILCCRKRFRMIVWARTTYFSVICNDKCCGTVVSMRLIRTTLFAHSDTHLRSSVASTVSLGPQRIHVPAVVVEFLWCIDPSLVETWSMCVLAPLCSLGFRLWRQHIISYVRLRTTDMIIPTIVGRTNGSMIIRVQLGYVQLVLRTIPVKTRTNAKAV
jgi:hypothetical protein